MNESLDLFVDVERTCQLHRKRTRLHAFILWQENPYRYRENMQKHQFACVFMCYENKT